MSIHTLSANINNNPIVSPPKESIEAPLTTLLSNGLINTGGRIGSYINKSFYTNHDALLLRSQLLSKNMRENHFNFYTNKSHPYVLSYFTTYLTSQKISTIFYTNYFNLPRQSEELSDLLSQYNPISIDLTKQYSFIVTNEYLTSGDPETLLNAIANEYSTNYGGSIVNVLLYIKAFTIDFPKNKLGDAITFASSDSRISNSAQNGYVSSAEWTGKLPASRYGCDMITWPRNRNGCYSENGVENEWPNFLCVWNKEENRAMTKEEIIEFNNLPECYGDPEYSDPTISAFWHLDRLDDPALPLDRCYRARTKIRNRTENAGGTCTTLKEPVYAYILDQPMSFFAPNHPEFEGRLNTFYGPFFGYYDHGCRVASLVGGRNCGITRKPELVGVGVLSTYGSSLAIIAEGINSVIADRINYPDRKMVMNLSLGAFVGYDSSSNIMESALQQAIDNDIIVVVAAGNSSIDASYFSPARMPDVITVGATRITGSCGSVEYGVGPRAYSDSGMGWRGHYVDTLAKYSNYGSIVDIYAPGSFISSAVVRFSYGRYRYIETPYSLTGSWVIGTSFASPLVAGVASEILRNIGKVTQKQMKEILVGYAAGGDSGVVGQWNFEDAYGIFGLIPGIDNNKLLQNPFINCIPTEEINDLDDSDDCDINIIPQITILQQPTINASTNIATIDAKLLYGTISNEKYLYIPDVGIEWQAKAPASENFIVVGYGPTLDTSELSNNTTIRALLSFPSITGDSWNSNENSIVSDEQSVSPPTYGVCCGWICTYVAEIIWPDIENPEDIPEYEPPEGWFAGGPGFLTKTINGEECDDPDAVAAKVVELQAELDAVVAPLGGHSQVSLFADSSGQGCIPATEQECSDTFGGTWYESQEECADNCPNPLP